MAKARTVHLMSEMNTPELYRTLGGIEATLKQVAGSVDTLAKAQNETTIAVTKMAGQIDAINGDMAAVDKRAIGAQATADEAKKMAEKAHARMDRMVWTASGVGAGAGAVIGLLAPKALEFIQHLV